MSQEITVCRICGRELTDPHSVRLGIGPECRFKSKALDRISPGLYSSEWTLGIHKRGVVVLYDLNGDRSLTNDMDNVLERVIEEHDLTTDSLVIYRDSMGIFDQVKITSISPVAFEFVSLNMTDEDKAVDKLFKTQNIQRHENN